MKKTFYLLSIIILSALHGNCTKQTVQVANFSFTPANFTIALGDTVMWVIASGTHTTTSLGIPAGAVAWNAPINSTSTSFTYVPAVTGTYNYQCNIHVSMQGAFTVTGCPPVSGQVSAAGATSVCKPASVTLNCNATAGAFIQWQKNGTNISGATGLSYNATATGSYRVRLTNNCGSTFTTNVISVTVTTLPVAVIAGNDTVFKCAADTATLNATTTGSVTYQWFKNNVAITGATNPIYKTKAAGSYKVKVTKVPSGCSKTSKVTKVINNCREESDLVAYDLSMELNPNPASQQIKLSFESLDQYATVRIINVTGQVLMEKKAQSADNNFEQQFDISNLAAGVYTMLVETESGLAHRLFVKE